MRKSVLPIAAAAAMAFGASSPALAVDYTFSKDGVDYTAAFNLVADGATTDTYEIVFTIDTNSANFADYIQAISFYATSDNTANQAAVMTAAPGGTGVWANTDGQLATGGCNGSANNGDCFQTSQKVAPLDGSTYTFKFDVTAPDGTFLLESGPHLQVSWWDEVNGQLTNHRGNLVSNYIAPAIPEPSTYALMFAGLAAVGFMARRRRQQA